MSKIKKYFQGCCTPACTPPLALGNLQIAHLSKHAILVTDAIAPASERECPSKHMFAAHAKMVARQRDACPASSNSESILQ